MLLQDHSQRVHLSNGLVVEVQVVGVLSVDLSGYVSISLWNRNCEALVKNRCLDCVLHVYNILAFVFTISHALCLQQLFPEYLEIYIEREREKMANKYFKIIFGAYLLY